MLISPARQQILFDEFLRDIVAPTFDEALEGTLKHLFVMSHFPAESRFHSKTVNLKDGGAVLDHVKEKLEELDRLLGKTLSTGGTAEPLDLEPLVLSAAHSAHRSIWSHFVSLDLFPNFEIALYDQENEQDSHFALSEFIDQPIAASFMDGDWVQKHSRYPNIVGAIVDRQYRSIVGDLLE